MKKVETIIVGGGVSGLACGKTLHENGKDFLLLTKEVGGRMLTSKSRKINYGASYITSDYKNVMPYMGGGKKIKISDCYFLNNKTYTTFYCLKTLRNLPQLLRLYFIARDFRKRLNKLRKEALHKEQKTLLNIDPVLKAYTKQSARDFVKKYCLEELNDFFFNPLFNSTGFVECEKSNAFQYLDNLMALFCTTYVANHEHCVEQLTKGWKKKIMHQTAKKLSRKKKGFVVQTHRKKYFAKNVVLALPYKDAKLFCNVPKPAHNVPVYVLDVKGKRKAPYAGKSIVFFQPKNHDITILWSQYPRRDIIFSKVKNPELKQYYKQHRIIKNTHWLTAAVLSGKNWIKQDLGNGLFLASDYNICGLEDAFITGVYAANRVLRSK